MSPGAFCSAAGDGALRLDYTPVFDTARTRLWLIVPPILTATIWLKAREGLWTKLWTFCYFSFSSFIFILGFTAVHFESLFTLNCNNKGTRGHLAKLSKPRCQKAYFFSHRVINRWNTLDGETVSSGSINAFKNRLNKIRMTRMGYFMD